jgi:rhodanese-related sulfurtransferase
MKEITPLELKKRLDANDNFQLIDVREPHENEMANIGGDLIPVGSVIDQSDKIARDKDVIVYCRSGNRSGAAIMALERQKGFTNLYNLKGGILAYAKEVDNSLSVF